MILNSFIWPFAMKYMDVLNNEQNAYITKPHFKLRGQRLDAIYTTLEIAYIDDYVTYSLPCLNRIKTAVKL